MYEAYLLGLYLRVPSRRGQRVNLTDLEPLPVLGKCTELQNLLFRLSVLKEVFPFPQDLSKISSVDLKPLTSKQSVFVLQFPLVEGLLSVRNRVE